MLATTTDSDVWRAVEEARPARFRAVLAGTQVPPAGIITVQHAERLWQAGQAKCDELAPVGQGRETGYYSSDGKSCSTLVHRGNPDGTDTVWWVEAHVLGSHPEEPVEVRVRGPYTDSHDGHWERLLRENPRHVVAQHGWYGFGSGSSGGFGGRVFRFRDLATDEVITWNDMWFAGRIPPAWHERIPDTHEMIQGSPPGWAPV